MKKGFFFCVLYNYKATFYGNPIPTRLLAPIDC